MDEKLELWNYVLITVYGRSFFKAASDEEAELIVEGEYTEDDGPMSLFRLKEICSWY